MYLNLSYCSANTRLILGALTAITVWVDSNRPGVCNDGIAGMAANLELGKVGAFTYTLPNLVGRETLACKQRASSRLYIRFWQKQHTPSENFVSFPAMYKFMDNRCVFINDQRPDTRQPQLQVLPKFLDTTSYIL